MPRCPILTRAAVAVNSADAAPVVFSTEGAFTAAITGPEILIDFNGDPVGNIVGNEYAGSGLVFASPLSGPLGQERYGTRTPRP